MNILYFIPSLSQTGGGIRQYAIAMLNIIAKDISNRYYILHLSEDEEALKILEINKNLIVIPKSIAKERRLEKWITVTQKTFNIILEYYNRTSKRISVYSYVDRLCRKYNIDLVYSPFQIAPYTSRKIIFTLHDVQELHFPEFFSPSERFTRAFSFLDSLKRADSVVVSYEHIKEDILRFFPYLRQEQIHVCLLDMTNIWIERFIDEPGKEKKDENKLIKPFEDFDYLLYPANAWPHKNHIRLMEAISMLMKNHGLKVNLICTGATEHRHFGKIKEKIKELGIHEQVDFLGIVSEETLYYLYKKCRGVVIPTLYEAGSFPLVESILLSIPVICSNVTSLPDTIGSEEFVFDPRDTEDISRRIFQLWNNEEYRQRCLSICSIAAAKLKGNDALKKIQDAILSLQN